MKDRSCCYSLKCPCLCLVSRLLPACCEENDILKRGLWLLESLPLTGLAGGLPFLMAGCDLLFLGKSGCGVAPDGINL